MSLQTKEQKKNTRKRPLKNITLHTDEIQVPKPKKSHLVIDNINTLVSSREIENMILLIANLEYEREYLFACLDVLLRSLPLPIINKFKPKKPSLASIYIDNELISIENTHSNDKEENNIKNVDENDFRYCDIKWKQGTDCFFNTSNLFQR